MKKLTLDFSTPINENDELTAVETKEEVIEESKEVEEEVEKSENETEESAEDSPEEVETEEISENEPEEKRNDYRIEQIVPFSMSVTDNPQNPETKIASLFFIAKSKSGIIYSLYTSYLLENEYEVDQIKNLPFHVENNFSSFRIASNMVINSYDVFATDFNFTYNKDIEDYKFNIKAIRQDNEGLHETVQLNMISDVFNSLKYIDTYVFDNSLNNYELSVASLSATDDVPDTKPTELINVSKINRIVAMAQLKNSTTCAVEYIVEDDNNNKYTVLSSFNLGVKFNKRKFKGMTVEKINNNYLIESDQYLQLYSTYCRFNNIDKEYLISRARNKDNKTIMFMLDTTIRTELESMIGEY